VYGDTVFIYYDVSFYDESYKLSYNEELESEDITAIRKALGH
jgi:hypothetical protein